MNERLLDVPGQGDIASALLVLADAIKGHEGPIAIITGGHFPSIHIGDGCDRKEP